MAKILTGADDEMQAYLDSIADSKPLSREDEVELAKRIKRGDETARNKLVEANLRFVVSIAKQYQHRGLTLMEIISAGNMGLLEAAGRFDGARGFKFISYAVWWIRQAILQVLADQVRTVRLPINRLALLKDISKASRRLSQAQDREPDIEAIAAELDMSPKEVVEVLRDGRAIRSLDEPFDEYDGRTLLNLLPDEAQAPPDVAALDSSVIEILRTELEILDKREQKILRLYYGLDGQNPITLEKIGGIMGLTRERIRQLKERALAKLRDPSRSRLREACGLPPEKSPASKTKAGLRNKKRM